MFYRIEIIRNGNIKSQAIYPYDTLEEAVEAWHYFMYYQANQGADFALGIVIDNDGVQYCLEKYEKPVPAAE